MEVRNFLRTACCAVLACVTLFVPFVVAAQATTGAETTSVERALVERVVSDTPTSATGTVPQSYNEVVQARVLGGTDAGTETEFSLLYTDGDGQKLDAGDVIYVNRFSSSSGNADLSLASYASLDHDRLPAVMLFVGLFVLCIALVGGKQGIRGLVSLSCGILLIIFVLLPGVLAGYSPILLSILIASFVATLGAYVTHGWSRMTSAAIIGMLLTILLATLLSYIGVQLGYLSGVTDENTYNLLIFPYNNVVINFQGLLLGGIIIGILGVLYDAAIGQAVAVEELSRAGPELSRAVVYRRALRIGREHIGALVNTLVLAYVGASLPMMLTLYALSLSTSSALPPIANWEFIATEIIRTTVGAIGLVLAIPLTTLVAVWMLVPKAARAGNAKTP